MWASLCLTLWLGVLLSPPMGPSLSWGQRIVFPGETVQPPKTGQSCRAGPGQAGRCVHISSCRSALQHQHVRPLVYCGASDRDAMVCCPNTLTGPPTPGPTATPTPPPNEPPNPLKDISKPALYDSLDCGLATERTVFQGHRSARSAQVGAEADFAIPPSKIAAVGGVDAVQVWPWMALLGRRSGGSTTWYCGAALINKQWLLTAAHCFQLEMNIVRLGEHDHNDDFDGAPHQDVAVAQTVVHPDYSSSKGYHDLALVRLTRQVTLNNFIKPVCLAWGSDSFKDVVEQSVTLTGWGDTQFQGNPSSILQEVYLNVFPTSVCDQQYSTLSDYGTAFPQGIGAETLCAGYLGGGRDACQGDSGGPLVSLNTATGRHVLEGIVSRGYGCAREDFYGLYAKMRHQPYLAWVKRVAFS